MKKSYLICLLMSGCLIFQSLPANAKKVTLVGIPITQIRTTIDSAFHIKLDNNQKVSNRLVIIKEDGKYFWETRDHSELIFTKKKHFHLFIDPETGGYIKVIKQENGKLFYMEHITFKNFKGFTYWGVVNTYEP